MASKKPEVAIILNKMKKREQEQEPDFLDEDGMSDEDGLEACAEDLISALRERNPTGVADALRDAFAILQSSPEPDFDDEDFDDED